MTIELPTFETIDVNSLTPDVELNNINTPTISEIKEHLPELGQNYIGPNEDGDDQFVDNKWVIGKQEASVEGDIISRTYAELLFDQDAYDFDFIKEGDADEFGTEDYWRVLHRFTEIEYYSDSSPDLQDFRVWEESRHTWQQEIIFRHENIGNIRWDRPQVTAPLTTTPPAMGAPVGTLPTYACPLDEPDAPNGETGESVAFLVPSVIDENTLPSEIKCCRWASLPLDWEIIFDVGQALGGFYETDGTVTEVKLIAYDDAMPTPNIIAEDDPNVNPGTEADPMKFNRRFLRLRFDMERDAPTYVELHRYGKDNYRIFLPYERDTEPEICTHEASALTTKATGTYPKSREELIKYRPPNKLNDFPNNFWNDTDVNSLDDYSGRAGNPGGFTEG